MAAAGSEGVLVGALSYLANWMGSPARGPATTQNQATHVSEAGEEDDELHVNDDTAESKPGADTDDAQTAHSPIRHLGSDSPSADEEEWEVGDASPQPLKSHPAPTSLDMGAEQSHEVNAALHATSDKLQGHRKPASTSTGKLQATQKRANGEPASRQRRLGEKNGIRGSTYDEYPGSPTSLSPQTARVPQEEPISPLRRSKRNQTGTATEQPQASSAPKSPAKRGPGRPKKPTPRVTQDAKKLGARPPKHLLNPQSKRNNAKASATAPQLAHSRTTHGAARGAPEEENHVLVELRKRRSEGTDGVTNGNVVAGAVRGVEAAQRSGVFPSNPKKRKQSPEEPVQSTRAAKRRQVEQDQITAEHEENDAEDGEYQITVQSEDEDDAENDDTAEQEEGDETEDSGAESRVDDYDIVSQRLCGKWRSLQDIFRGVQHVGRNVNAGLEAPRNRILLKDKQVKEVVDLCKEACERYVGLIDHSGSLSPDDDPAGILSEIGEKVDGLLSALREDQTDSKNKRKITNIYYPLIPKLVGLLRRAAVCYISIDNGRVTPGQVTVGHLRILDGIIKMILDLEQTASQSKPRPATNLKIVQPVHNRIAAPLRAVRVAFSLEIQDHALAIEIRKRKEELARQRALQLEQEERRSRQEARIERLREKWHKLHAERVHAESGFINTRKREHLQVPSATDYEYDQNGERFLRQEVFVPRVGPPPGLVDLAAEEQWTADELTALHDGLRQYTGPLVFEKIFRRYCRRGEVLNRFNVVQIVTTAAIMKEKFTEAQMEDTNAVEQWVADIPVWTKGQMALGKENETSLVDLDGEP